MTRTPFYAGDPTMMHIDEREPYDAASRRVDPGAPIGPCRACQERRRRGFDGQCPACASERARQEMAAERARLDRPTVTRRAEVPSLYAPRGPRYVVRLASDLPPETMVAPCGALDTARDMATRMATRLNNGEREHDFYTWGRAGDPDNGWCVVDVRHVPLGPEALADVEIPAPDPLPIVSAVLLEHYQSAHGAAAVVVALEAAGCIASSNRRG